jgi:alkylation response protein AidB-like acyl-CoA dehydrogenase
MTAYPPELQAFQDLGASFARRELLENRATHDRYPFAPFWDGVMRRATELGFFGITLGELWGGSASDTAALVPLCEEISRVDASLAAIIFTNAAALEILNAAAESMDYATVFGKLSGEGVLPLAFQSYTCLGESVLPSVQPAGSGPTITGTVRNVALGGIARYAVVAAAGGDGSAAYFLADLNGPGVGVSAPVHCIGFRACPSADLTFDAAVVLPLGAPASGVELFQRMAQRLAPVAAAVLLGIMKGCFDEAYAYVQERRQGGRTIIDWPAVSTMLAEMSVDINLAERCLLDSLRGATVADARVLAIRLGEWACRCTTDGVQLLGGNGYMTDYGQEKRLRDARMARQLLGMPALRKQDAFNEQWRASGSVVPGERESPCPSGKDRVIL